jgi:hypothetical protein
MKSEMDGNMSDTYIGVQSVQAALCAAGNAFPSDLHMKSPCLKSFTTDLHV